MWANAKDLTKTNERVKFTFNHALARLSFDITANQKLEENGAVIKVKEVRLYGADENKGIFIMAGYLNLEMEIGLPKIMVLVGFILGHQKAQKMTYKMTKKIVSYIS